MGIEIDTCDHQQERQPEPKDHRPYCRDSAYTDAVTEKTAYQATETDEVRADFPPSVDSRHDTDRHRGTDSYIGQKKRCVQDSHQQVRPESKAHERVYIRHRALARVIDIEILHFAAPHHNPYRGDGQHAGQ